MFHEKAPAGYDAPANPIFNRPRVYVSFAPDAETRAQSIVAALQRKYGLQQVVFNDRSLGAMPWSEVLRRIQSCTAFVMLLSARAANSAHAHAEFTEAYRTQRAIIPVRVDAEGRLPKPLEAAKVVDMTNPAGIGMSLTALYRAIEQRTSEQPALPPKPRWVRPTPPPSGGRRAQGGVLPVRVRAPQAADGQMVTARRSFQGRVVPGMMAMLLAALLVLGGAGSTENPPLTNPRPVFRFDRTIPTPNPAEIMATNASIQQTADALVPNNNLTLPSATPDPNE